MTVADVLNDASAQLHVDLETIIDNYNILNAQSNAACAAVVKADAYGLGMEKIAPALFHHTECNTFFVANLVEAVKLRSILKGAKIYVFNGLFEDHVDISEAEDNANEFDSIMKAALISHFDIGLEDDEDEDWD